MQSPSIPLWDGTIYFDRMKDEELRKVVGRGKKQADQKNEW